MAKKQKQQIDEDFMREIISQGIPVKSNTPINENKKELTAYKEPKIKLEDIQKFNDENQIPKDSRTDYQSLYLQKMTFVNRKAVYISRSTHEKLTRIVTVIGEGNATVGSYLEAIILDHFSQHQNEVNNLFKKNMKTPL